MKKLLISASTLASAMTLACAAQAADIAPAGYDWSGFYAGVNAGVAWNNSSIDQDFRYEGTHLRNLQDKIEGDQAAFTGGGILGYNYQMDQIVLGVEADINYLGFGDDKSAKNVYENDYGTIESTRKLSFDADWYGTLRGRLGFAADNMLFYGTGGLAYGHMAANGSVKIENTDDGDYVKWDGSTDSVNWGWTIGAGMEYGIDNWSLGVEYLFVDLGSAEWDGNGRGTIEPLLEEADAKGSVDYQFSVVRATAKLRF